ncbi:tetratricopeptide repeat protein [Rhizomicrobium electricum]|uniref:Tetratricopeptide repeat protein n=1 Tax=Rhizomicrobium electricum TaxID=480070 RepID=A0ABN1EUL8_9PROT|nr:tetratricopeptide repeat protein [Rhizomicrobium electricum]NIJ49607.1 tetratricopeptide (TPR) repeat protein [Rhizomicrobium electricum]
MWRAGLAFLVLASGAAFGSASGNLDEELGLLQSGINRAQANDCAGAVPPLKQAVDAPAFSQLNDRQQYIGVRILAVCAFSTRDNPTALKMSRIATASNFADKTDWYFRTLASWVSEDKDDASRSLERLVTWPDQISFLQVSTLYSILNGSQGTPEGDARNARIVKALYDAKWRPTDEPEDSADGLWQRHARYLLKAGKVAEARKVVASITWAGFVVDARSEKLFDPLVAADPARYDIRKAHEAAVVRLKARVAATPDKIKPVVELTYTFYQLDRPEEGLALIDEKLAAIKAGKKFADQDEELNWLYDRRAMLLTELGRTDEAIAAFKAGSQFGEGGANVSQTINLADTYYSLGRPAEAIKVLANFDPKNASPFGAMAAQEARVCAYAQLGDKPALAKSLEFVQAHAGDAPGIAMQALLCAGEENEAAALTLKFLGDEKHRNDMLERLHTSVEPAKGVDMPFAKLLRERRLALAKRPEIVAAAETFGHILDLPLVTAW